MEKDWRLVNQSKYLFGKVLFKTIFKQDGECDHAHCAFCWGKFSEDADDIHCGYCTTDKMWWICETCFHDFKDQFKWLVKENETGK